MKPIPQEALDLMNSLNKLLPKYGDDNFEVCYSEYKDKVSAEIYNYKINIKTALLYGESTEDIVNLVVKRFDEYTKGYI